MGAVNLRRLLSGGVERRRRIQAVRRSWHGSCIELRPMRCIPMASGDNSLQKCAQLASMAEKAGKSAWRFSKTASFFQARGLLVESGRWLLAAMKAEEAALLFRDAVTYANAAVAARAVSDHEAEADAVDLSENARTQGEAARTAVGSVLEGSRFWYRPGRHNGGHRG